jgi:hypothetical protein
MVNGWVKTVEERVKKSHELDHWRNDSEGLSLRGGAVFSQSPIFCATRWWRRCQMDMGETGTLTFCHRKDILVAQEKLALMLEKWEEVWPGGDEFDATAAIGG